MIEIKSCCKAFGSQTVLQDVSLTIPDGRIIGIFGASGIGKSTLAKLLCGVIRPDTGTILLDGQTLVSGTAPYDRKRGLHIQMVYQQPHASLDPSQKLGAGLRELIAYHHLAACRREADSQICSIFDAVQLPQELQNHLPYQISGGEAQRAALARCLLLQPKLLILDEATSMLDISTQAAVLSLVRRLMLERGGSVLFISHDRALTDYYCDTVYEFDGAHRLREVQN